MLVAKIKTYIIKKFEFEKWWRMKKLLTNNLNLAYDINAPKYARMFKFLKSFFWEAAYFQGGLYTG